VAPTARAREMTKGDFEHGSSLCRPEAYPQVFRQDPRSAGDAEPHRGSEILLRPVPEVGRRRKAADGEGIQGVFQSVFPIKDFNETAVLEFVKYELEKPKYDVDECQSRDMTYAAPLKVTLRLIVFDVDETTGARSVKDIKEQDVFMGDMPLMTSNGTFIVNGTERVIVSQMHRSPGVFFDHDKGKTHSSGKLLFACRIIPYRGSWLDFEFDAKDIVFARIDRRRKLPVTTLLYALGMDQEGIMDAYYQTVSYKYVKNKGWVTKFFPERVRGTRPTYDIVDAATGEVICKAGDKMTPAHGQEVIKRARCRNCWCPSTRSWASMSPRTSSTRKPARSGSRPATS
jgi:DNA-directed RNA polymerase subunit beta